MLPARAVSTSWVMLLSPLRARNHAGQSALHQEASDLLSYLISCSSTSRGLLVIKTVHREPADSPPTPTN